MVLNTRSGEQAYNSYLSTFIFGLLSFILIPVACFSSITTFITQHSQRSWFLSPASCLLLPVSCLLFPVSCLLFLKSHISNLTSHISTLPVSRNRSVLAKMRTGFTRWFSFFSISLTAFLLCKPAITDGIIIKKKRIYYSRFIVFHPLNFKLLTA